MSFITDLINKITNFRVKVGDKLNTLKNQIGQLNSLTTNDKTSLVGAINEVNNIQIGGRNLLLQTTTSEINLVGGVDIYAEKAYKISNLEKNTEYIFSVIAKGDEMTLISFIPNIIVDYKSLTTEFKLYTWKFSTSNEPAILDFLIRAQAGKNITITKAKLEKGNEATDWSPTLEDINNLINQKKIEYKNTVKLPDNYRPSTKPLKVYKDDFLLIKRYPSYTEEVLVTQGGIDASATSVQVEMVIKTNQGVLQNPEKYFSVKWYKQSNGTYKYNGFKVNIAMADIIALQSTGAELDYELTEIK